MDVEYCLEKFNNAAKAIDKKLLDNKGIEIEIGIWLESVVFRLQKRHWANKPNEKPHSGTAIFMGIWLEKEAMAKQRLFYNIHALRLRQLSGYKLQSRAFATSFREKFKPFEQHWPNVSTNFAPQTLMEGWIDFDLENLQEEVFKLANRFLDIEDLVESTLLEFKK